MATKKTASAREDGAVNDKKRHWQPQLHALKRTAARARSCAWEKPKK